jgi:ferredoxin
VMDPVRGLALICDLCGGDPQCVKVCAHGAIELSRRRARVDPAQGKARRA